MEKDPTSYTAVTYAWVLALSMLGGAASFFGKVKSGLARWFNIVEFIGEIFISAFAGVVTFYLCEWSRFNPLLTAVLVAIAGHMGTRAIFVLERFFEQRILGQTPAMYPPRDEPVHGEPTEGVAAAIQPTARNQP